MIGENFFLKEPFTPQYDVS